MAITDYVSAMNSKIFIRTETKALKSKGNVKSNLVIPRRASRVILVNMVISVILGHEKTKIQNIIDLEMIDVFSVKTIIHSNNKKMGHLI